MNLQSLRALSSFKPMSLLLGVVLQGALLRAQTNFSEHIAPIVYGKCTSCHRPGEIGPMPFTSYAEVSAWASMIDQVTQSGYMPPWPPDAQYSNLVGERVLSAAEKQLIHDWVLAGAPQGDPNLEPALPAFPTGSVLGTPDLVLSMAEAYPVSGSNQDEYRVFVLPTGLAQDREIKAIEFRAGNRSVVHHALIVSEHVGAGQALDAASPGYGFPAFGGFGIPQNQIDDFHTAWAPGAVPDFYPQSTGQVLQANSDLLLQIHYAPSPIAATDSSYVNVFFADQAIQREVFNYEYAYTNLFLPAQQVTTVKRFFTVPQNYSLIGVLPHAHLIGTRWEMYYRTPQGDTVPVIKIPDWDFNWQGIYKPEFMLKVPAGSVFYAECTYDNTANNPFNPNNPPLPVAWGENTSDEMFYFILQLLPYQAGDENIALGNSLSGTDYVRSPDRLKKVYPNPAKDRLTVDFSLREAATLDWWVMDLSGRPVLRGSKQVPPGDQSLELNLRALARGAYVLELSAGGRSLRANFLLD